MDELARKPGDPSPEEIAEQCEAIQAKWSKHERRKRTVTGNRKWKPPAYSISRHADGNAGLEAKRD